MITGEALPVPKGPGDTLLGGTVNADGSLIMRATKVGSDTMLAGIARLVSLWLRLGMLGALGLQVQS